MTILNEELKEKLQAITLNLSFLEMNGIADYFIDEIEGDGINLNNKELDDPSLYYKYCIEDCEMSPIDLIEYINTFKMNNF